MRQNTQPSPGSCASAVATYSPRQPAQRWSSMGEDVGPQPLDELVDGHTALRLLAAAGVDADGSSGYVVVADHEHVRDLLQLGLPDPRPELVRRVLHVGPEPL